MKYTDVWGYNMTECEKVQWVLIIFPGTVTLTLFSSVFTCLWLDACVFTYACFCVWLCVPESSAGVWVRNDRGAQSEQRGQKMGNQSGQRAQEYYSLQASKGKNVANMKLLNSAKFIFDVKSTNTHL